MVEDLPVYKIKGKLYYRDVRLREYRNIDNPTDTISIDISNEELQTPTKKDNDYVYKKYLRDKYTK
jgi:hypothetical protein